MMGFEAAQPPSSGRQLVVTVRQVIVLVLIILAIAIAFAAISVDVLGGDDPT
jgi:hypothetical protein